ncbi:hypothetical protein [Rossellomorea sp. BNER]|nr:hypothetical protein [Rossellomorea sp. BNER]
MAKDKTGGKAEEKSFIKPMKDKNRWESRQKAKMTSSKESNKVVKIQ